MIITIIFLLILIYIIWISNGSPKLSLKGNQNNFLDIINLNMLQSKLINKNISFILILISIIMLFYANLTKFYVPDDIFEDYYMKKLIYNGHIKPSLKFYKVDFFGIFIKYTEFILFFTIILGIGFFLLVINNNKKR